MSTIFKMLLDNGLDPKIINYHNKLTLIELTRSRIRFINLSNFIMQHSIADLRLKQFFPTSTINDYCFHNNYFPARDDFYCMTDDSTLREDKKTYYQSLRKREWNFSEKIQEYIFFIMQKIIQLSFNFLLESQTFQQRAFRSYNKPFAFLHPFSDSSSKNAYVFKLFQTLDLNYRDLYAIPNETNGISIKTSRPENEFVSFLQYKKPQNEMIHAFSPYGQLKKNSIPYS